MVLAISSAPQEEDTSSVRIVACGHSCLNVRDRPAVRERTQIALIVMSENDNGRVLNMQGLALLQHAPMSVRCISRGNCAFGQDDELCWLRNDVFGNAGIYTKTAQRFTQGVCQFRVGRHLLLWWIADCLAWESVPPAEQ